MRYSDGGAGDRCGQGDDFQPHCRSACERPYDLLLCICITLYHIMYQYVLEATVEGYMLVDGLKWPAILEVTRIGGGTFQYMVQKARHMKITH